MQETQIRQACLELMATAPAVYLGSVGSDGSPRIRAMLNLRNQSMYPRHMHLYAAHDRDFMVYLSTNTSSDKRLEIESHPRIALYYAAPEKFLGVCLVGDAEIITNPALKSAVWVDGWERYYSQLGTPEDPDYTLLRVFPQRVDGWLSGAKFSLEVAS